MARDIESQDKFLKLIELVKKEFDTDKWVYIEMVKFKSLLEKFNTDNKTDYSEFDVMYHLTKKPKEG